MSADWMRVWDYDAWIIAQIDEEIEWQLEAIDEPASS